MVSDPRMRAGAEDTVSLEFGSRQQKQVLYGLRALCNVIGESRTLSLQTYDSHRRTERRVNELKDDIEVMPKAELKGSLTHLEGKLECMLRPILDRVLVFNNVTARVAALARKL